VPAIDSKVLDQAAGDDNSCHRYLTMPVAADQDRSMNLVSAASSQSRRTPQEDDARVQIFARPRPASRSLRQPFLQLAPDLRVKLVVGGSSAARAPSAVVRA